MTGGNKGRFMMARWTGKWMQVSLDERESSVGRLSGSVNPAVSERQSGEPSGWRRSRWDSLV